jgi:hypothetical protein
VPDIDSQGGKPGFELEYAQDGDVTVVRKFDSGEVDMWHRLLDNHLQHQAYGSGDTMSRLLALGSGSHHRLHDTYEQEVEEGEQARQAEERKMKMLDKKRRAKKKGKRKGRRG